MSSITHAVGSSSDGLTERLAKLGPPLLTLICIAQFIVMLDGVVVVALVPGKASGKGRWRHAIGATLGQPWPAVEEVQAR